MEVNQNSLSPLLKPRFQKETITREQRAAPPLLLGIYKPAKELLPLSLTLLAAVPNHNRVKCTQFQAHVWSIIHRVLVTYG